MHGAYCKRICNAAAVSGNIFMTEETEGCSTSNDGKVATTHCTEKTEDKTFTASGDKPSCIEFMSEPMESELTEADYLETCMKSSCVEVVDNHALECQCRGPMKSVVIPKDCNDGPDPREQPTANLGSFGMPKSSGAIIGHMAFAILMPRENPNFTANWTIIGTGETVFAKPGFNFWINVMPGMSPGLGMLKDMFLYEGQLRLSGWISFDNTFRINGMVRQLAMDNGKKYIPYLNVTISNEAPYLVAEGEIYLNRDFLVCLAVGYQVEKCCISPD